MEKPTIRLVVFDMAGTTVDEDNVVYKTLRQAVNAQGYAFGLDKVLELGAGKEKFQAIRDLLATAVSDERQLDKEAKRAFQHFLLQLKKAYAELDVKTFPGTPQLFAYLRERGVRVALNTGYNRTTARSLLDKLGWQEGTDYDLLVTADDVSRGRPAPDMILEAMQRSGVNDPKEVAKIGDSAVDIEEGRAAGCGLNLGVTTGAQTQAQLLTARPDAVIDSLEEIKALIALPNSSS